MGIFCLCFQAELLFYNSLCSRCRGVTPGLLLDHAKGHSEFIQVYMGCWSFRLRRHRQRAWMWSASFSYAPGNKRKKYCWSSIQSHLGVLYEKMFGVTNHKIDVTTTGFLGAMLSACLVLDASENADFQCRLLILQGSVSHCPSSWALKARKPPKYTKTLLVETLILCLHPTFFCTSWWCCWSARHAKKCGLHWDSRTPELGCVDTTVKCGGTIEDFTSLASKPALPVYWWDMW